MNNLVGGTLGVLTAFLLTPMATFAQEVEWAGPYIGLHFAQMSGDWDETFDDGESTGELFYDVEGRMRGAFAGLNFQNGPLLYGIEVAFSKGEVVSKSWSSPDEWETVYDVQLRNILEAKVRIGFPNGRVLPYAFIGASRIQMGYGLDGAWGSQDYSGKGMNYGAGVELRIGENGFAGIEFILRDVSSDLDGLESWTATSKTSAIQVRGGLTF